VQSTSHYLRCLDHYYGKGRGREDCRVLLGDQTTAKERAVGG